MRLNGYRLLTLEQVKGHKLQEIRFTIERRNDLQRISSWKIGQTVLLESVLNAQDDAADSTSQTTGFILVKSNKDTFAGASPISVSQVIFKKTKKDTIRLVIHGIHWF